MSGLFSDKSQLEAVYMRINGIKVPLLQVNINSTVGALATCVVTIASGYQIKDTAVGVLKSKKINILDLAKPGADCDVDIVMNGTRCRIFSGEVSGVTNTYVTVASAVQVRHQVHIAMPAAMLDSVPVAAKSLVTKATGKLVKKTSFMNIRNSNFIAHIKNLKSPTINIAEFIRDVIDSITMLPDKKQHRGSVAGGSAGVRYCINTATCPELRAIPGNQEKFAHIVTDFVVSALETGATYWNAFTRVCSEFFLTTVPNIKTGHVDILPAIAWNKKIAAKLKARDIISISSSFVGKGRNEVDAVIVSHNAAATTKESDSTSAELSVVFGEGIKGNKPCAITNPKDLEERPGTAPRKYITRLLPSWVVNFGEPALLPTNKRQRNKKPQDGVCTTVSAGKGATGWNTFAAKWASMLARTTFAQLNRAHAVAQLTVRLEVWLWLCSFLGKVVSFDPPDSDLQGSNKMPVHVGYLSSQSLQIDVGADRLQIRAAISLSHVRTKEENDILGIEESVYVK